MKTIPSALQKLCFSTFIFKMKITYRNHKKDQSDYTMTKAFKFDENLEQKYKDKIIE